MKIETKQETLQRRKEIEKELLEMLKETESDVLGGISPAEKSLEYQDKQMRHSKTLFIVSHLSHPSSRAPKNSKAIYGVNAVHYGVGLPPWPSEAFGEGGAKERRQILGLWIMKKKNPTISDRDQPIGWNFRLACART